MNNKQGMNFLNGAGYRNAGAFFGIAGVLLYALATLVAAALFPGHFSPLDSTISHLGNATANPGGAALFDAGYVLTGLLFVPFGLSLAARHSAGKRAKPLLYGATLAGLGLSAGLILVGTYPENVLQAHVQASVFTFLCLTILVLLTNLALYCDSHYPRWIAAVGFTAAIVNCLQIGLYMIAGTPTILEWLSAWLPLAWILSFCGNGLRMEGSEGS